VTPVAVRPTPSSGLLEEADADEEPIVELCPAIAAFCTRCGQVGVGEFCHICGQRQCASCGER